MSTIDVASLLAEISPEAPSGPNLAYEPKYVELEKLAQEKPSRLAGKGKEELPPEPRPWPNVLDRSIELLSRTKDLRIAISLISALLHTDGLAGARDGLILLRGLLDRYWDTLYPKLDAEEGNDPTERFNVIRSLCSHETILRYIRNAPLVTSSVMGSFCLRDLDIAAGKLKPTNTEKEVPTIQKINAAFNETPIESLKASAEVVNEALDQLRAMDAFLTSKAGNEDAPNLAPIISVFTECRSKIGEHLKQRVPQSNKDTNGAERTEPHDSASDSVAPYFNGQIKSRADVIRALDSVCEFFERNEPSSPVPLLIQRAKGLMSKDFLEILRDLTPEGAKKLAEVFCSRDSDKK